MMNVDCDMFPCNPKVIQHGICSLLGEQECGFAQCSSVFYNPMKDDPFGNQLLKNLIDVIERGMDGIQGPTYCGSGCFHRRKVIYGVPPIQLADNIAGNVLPADHRTLEEGFGNSSKFCKSVAEILSGSGGKWFSPAEISSTLESASRVADCGYENNTCWGKEVGLTYGSTSDDILTGLRIHEMGWKSMFLTPSPPAFMDRAPQVGLDFLTQIKRWGKGNLQILFSKHFPILAAFTSKLHFRQALAYSSILFRSLGSPLDVCYTLLSAYCIISNTCFLPKAREPAIYFPVSIFLIGKIQLLALYLVLGKSLRALWNAHRMERIVTTSSMFSATLIMFLKFLGLTENVFEVTKKTSQQSSSDSDETVGRFAFNESPILVPGTTLLLVHLTALATWALGWQPAARGGDGSGLGEILCSTWVVLNFWPFLRGLFGKGKYGIPWSTVWKSAALAFLFVQLSRMTVEA